MTRHYTVDYLSLANRDIMMTEDGSYTERYVYDAAGKRLSTEMDYAESTRRGEAGENFQSDFAADTGKVWYRSSLLNSTLFAVDADGEVIAHMIYDAWGNPLVESYTDANLAGLVNRNNYTGYTWDETLGLYFAQSRFYDAENHRFTQEDIIKDGANWYAYCGNNPAVYVDMYGLVMVAQDYINSGSGTPPAKPKAVNNRVEFGAVVSAKIGTMGDNPNPSSGNVIFSSGRTLQEEIAANDGYMEPVECDEYFVTKKQLQDFGWSDVSDSDIAELNRVLIKYEINTPNRISFFLGEVKHESYALSRTLEKFDGDDPEEFFNKKYGNRDHLGNTEEEDGQLFRGAGYIQLTGRYNYQRFADYIGDQNIMAQGYRVVGGIYIKPIEEIKSTDPIHDVIDIGKYAWEAAGYFWTHSPQGNLNEYADRKDFYRVALGINYYEATSSKPDDVKATEHRRQCVQGFYEIYTGQSL